MQLCGATAALHAQVEAAITRTGIAHTLVRPKVFMQGMLSRSMSPLGTNTAPKPLRFSA